MGLDQAELLQIPVLLLSMVQMVEHQQMYLQHIIHLVDELPFGDHFMIQYIQHKELFCGYLILLAVYHHHDNINDLLLLLVEVVISIGLLELDDQDEELVEIDELYGSQRLFLIILHDL